MKKIILPVIAMGVFLGGLVAYIGARARSEPTPRKSFVIVFKVTDVDAKGQSTLRDIRVQTVKATGEYRLTVLNPAAQASVEYVATKDSIYEVKPDCLQFFGATPPAQMNRANTPSAMRALPTFVREETLCALNAFVFRSVDGESWIETYAAPETGDVILKNVTYYGGGEYTITEPISIQFRDVSDDEVKLPDLPKRFDKAERRSREYLNGGAAAAGESLRREVDKRR